MVTSVIICLTLVCVTIVLHAQSYTVIQPVETDPNRININNIRVIETQTKDVSEVLTLQYMKNRLAEINRMLVDLGAEKTVLTTKINLFEKTLLIGYTTAK